MSEFLENLSFAVVFALLIVIIMFTDYDVIAGLLMIFFAIWYLKKGD